MSWRGRKWREVGFMRLGQFCIKPGSCAEVGFMQNAASRPPRPAQLRTAKFFCPTPLHGIGI
jgi:hypothetical protein